MEHRDAPLALLLSLLCVGCGPPKQGDEKGTFWKGERQTSSSLRGSKARPLPDDGDHAPLSSDRFGIGEAMERVRNEHRNEHSEWSLRLEGFSHPACVGLDAKRRQRCPMLAVRWGTVRDCAGGIEVELKESPIASDELRRAMLCHIAFGSSGGESHCPLHVHGVRVTAERQGGVWVYRLVVGDKDRVDELRARMRRLLR